MSLVRRYFERRYERMSPEEKAAVDRIGRAWDEVTSLTAQLDLFRENLRYCLPLQPR